MAGRRLAGDRDADKGPTEALVEDQCSPRAARLPNEE